MAKISVGIVTTNKFKDRYMSCKNSWVKDFEHVYFFSEKEEENSFLIKVPNSDDSYNSFFPKQQFGFKYMFEKNPNDDWYCVIGCDHLLIKDSIENFLDKQDPNIDSLFCQTYNRFETMNGFRFEIFAGGAGFFISNSLMKKIYPLIDEFNEEWLRLYNSGNLVQNCYACGDVALSYMVAKYLDIRLTNVDGMYSQNPIFYSDIVDKPLTFHYIKPFEMQTLYDKYK